MKRGYFLEDAEIGRIKIFPSDKEADVFTHRDKDYLEGKTRNRPLDLNLHIALYILDCEGLPEFLLRQVQEWVRNNPVAGCKIPNLIYGMNTIKTK